MAFNLATAQLLLKRRLQIDTELAAIGVFININGVYVESHIPGEYATEQQELTEEYQKGLAQRRQDEDAARARNTAQYRIEAIRGELAMLEGKQDMKAARAYDPATQQHIDSLLAERKQLLTQLNSENTPATTHQSPGVGVYEYRYSDGSGGRMEIHHVADSGKWFFIEKLSDGFAGSPDWYPLSWLGQLTLTPVAVNAGGVTSHFNHHMP